MYRLSGKLSSFQVDERGSTPLTRKSTGQCERWRKKKHLRVKIPRVQIDQSKENYSKED